MTLFADHVADPGGPALVFPGHCVSHGELWRRVEAVRHDFGNQRKLIALEAQPTEDFVIAYLACLRGGHAVALLPAGDIRLAESFTESFDPAILYSGRNGRLEKTSRHDGSGPLLHPDLAVMLATSGSEGHPRWVRLSRRNIESNAESIAAYLGLTPRDRAPASLPFNYSYGLSVLNSHLCAGGSIAFCGTSVIERAWMDSFRQLGCTGFSGVPYSYELLERIGFRDHVFPDLRYMTVAGGRLDPGLVKSYADFLERRGGRFFVMYGQTEATARMAYVPPDLVSGHPDRIGSAIPGGSLHLVDSQGQRIGSPGTPGELVYRGPNVMMGYATEASDLMRPPGSGELRTGDIASFDENGLFRIEGRSRRFSKIAGLRIGHDALEWDLRRQGLDCAVTGTDRLITVHYHGFAAEHDVAAMAAASSGLPIGYLAARRHSEIPRTAAGKTDYQALQSMLPRAAESSGDILSAVRAAFYPQHVAPDDSFHTLGGDSLVYVQMTLLLEKQIGRLPEGWETISFGELAAMARRAPARNVKGPAAQIETHMLARAAAILLIVVHHATLWPIPGGAAALLLMVGFGFARYQRTLLFGGHIRPFLTPMLRNLVPYFVIVAAYALAWEEIPWASVFLAGNLGLADPAQHTMLPFQFWFVEAYAQLCLLVGLLFAVPAIRRKLRVNPFEWGLALLALAFLLRYAVPLVHDIGNRKIFLLTYVLWFPIIGWCAFFADTARRKAILVGAVALLCPIAAYTGGNWQGSWTLYMLQLAVLLCLLAWNHVRLPSALVLAVMTLSAASYHIYLFHRIIPEAVGLTGTGAGTALAAIVIGVVSGLAAWQAQRKLFSFLGSRRLAGDRTPGISRA